MRVSEPVFGLCGTPELALIKGALRVNKRAVELLLQDCQVKWRRKQLERAQIGITDASW